jgi:hypothetical protein
MIDAVANRKPALHKQQQARWQLQNGLAWRKATKPKVLWISQDITQATT